MTIEQLHAIIDNGEDSKHQFKSHVKHPESLAREMVAYSNSNGGMILIGVTDNGELSGLTPDHIKHINQHISNAVSQHVKPPINVNTQNFTLPGGKVIVISIKEGENKPYTDHNGDLYVKSGADKRKIIAREEMLRMLQKMGHTDATLVHETSESDIDRDFFNEFFENEFGKKAEDFNVPFIQLLENMKLAKKGNLNYCGVLLFAKRPQFWFPIFIAKAVAFPGEIIEDVHYLDSRDIKGKLSVIFENMMGFVLAHIKHLQNGQGFNSIGEPEIPKIVLEELITNALIHRDYFISDSIKILVFSNRIEIINPGHLPNRMTVDNIKMGVSTIRNPIMASFASKILPFRGLGSGIHRALRVYPQIRFIDDRVTNTFKVIIQRQQN
ncbi:MAG: putative DNA binding domain-containing protein [Flavobacteriaceae bacterium]|nr:putative DNA binding domain-containing protein [Flavobacteriaceae bacterium]